MGSTDAVRLRSVGRIAALAAIALLTSASALRASAPHGFVTRSGDRLVLNGHTFRFTGVNAFQLATDYAVNTGCGPQPASPDAVFRDLPPHAVVRLWAFQSMAVNPVTHTLDWTALDRVVQAATADDVKLAMVLGDQGGGCDDDHWHDAPWYRGGFRVLHDDGGRDANVMSYAAWVHTIVPRYAHSSAIAYWEPVNEPQVSRCPAGTVPAQCIDHFVCEADGAAVLRSFFDVIGREIHRMDRWHPVASGTIGDDQCGTGAGTGRSDRDWLTVARSPGLDVLTVHDYATGQPLLQDDRAAAAARDIGKPVVYEEVGLAAGVGTLGCPSPQARARQLAAKQVAVFRERGIAGFLPWQWLAVRPAGCSLAVTPDDPLLPQLSARLG